MSGPVIITLALDAMPELERHLGAGVPVRRVPLLRFEPARDWSALDACLARLASYGAVAVTSPRTAAGLESRRAARLATGLVEPAPPVWAVGPATAKALGRSWGDVRVGGLHGRQTGQALAERMVEEGVRSPVLAPGAAVRRPELSRGLVAAGITVHEVSVYRTLLASPQEARAAIRGAAAVVVGSPSVASLLAEAWPSTRERPALVAIGATTGQTATLLGWSPAAVARAPTAPAMAAAVQEAIG
jgi:uroporphyrinogen-III synthase